MGDPARWALAPPIESDETFTSWFTRLAHWNGLAAPDLYRVVQPGARIHRCDLDRFAKSDFLEAVANRTRVPFADLRNATFDRWRGELFEADGGKGRIPWLATSGTGQDGSCKGQQFCPDCLGEDREPYFRQTWRLGFVTACHRHGRLLKDSCPACSAPIQPAYLEPYQGSSLADCWRCGFDLRRSSSGDIVAWGCVDRQRELIEIAQSGWAELGDYGIQYSLTYFWILWRIYRLVVGGRYARALRAWTIKEARLDPAAFELPALEVPERLSPHGRTTLLRLALELAYNWPHRFVRACQATGIGAGLVCPGPKRSPYALWHPVSQHLAHPNRPLGPEEIASACDLLQRMGYRASFTNLRDQLGLRPKGEAARYLENRERQAYGKHRFWKLDGVQPDVREQARRAARLSGERLGPWVERAVREKLERETPKI